MRTTAAPLVARALADEGAQLAFGIPGTHNIELYDAIESLGRTTPVLVTDEQSASFMADGVARASGAVGVVNLVPGAGVTHALSGIAEAWMDTVPMVVLTCGIRSDSDRAYQLHAIDQLALLAPVTKAQLRITDTASAYQTVRQAFALARSGAPGPVAIEVPANLYMLEGEAAAPAWQDPPPVAPPPAESVAAAARLLAASRHPVLYVGLGAAAASADLVRLAEALDAPVCTTISGKGVFPEDHPLFAWNGFGRQAPGFVRTVVDRADCMLAIGCRFGEVATASYGVEPPARLIHVDIDAAVPGRNFPAELAIAADAAAFVRALLDELSPRRRDGELERHLRQGHEEVNARWRARGGGERVSPHALLSSFAARAGEDAVWVTDSGNGTFLAMEHLRLGGPRRFLAPVDYSCMGYSVPAAIGAKLACPARDVIALAGDGALLMTGLELLTASTYGAAPVVCVLRDGELAQIAQFQRTSLGRATCAELHDYSVAALAAATGCEHLALERDDQAAAVAQRALTSARAGRPVLVDVAIDYSEKTYFTKGVLATNFWRLPWRDRLRLTARALKRRLAGPPAGAARG